jgi:DNA-binding NarL/FixJ family response regulator
MDVRMPVMDGLEATSKLLRVCPDSHVLVVTSCDEEPYPSRLLEAGAAGYLTKGASLEEMEQAIRMVTAGQRYIKSEIAQQMALKPFTQTTTANPFDSLSNREYQIAKMRADGKEVTEISDRLHLSPKTVNSYRYRIQEKLAVRNDQEVTRLAIKYGVIDLDIVKNNSASEEIATAD